MAAVLHVVALTYADLTLLAANAATCIIANVVISKNYLGEHFDHRFDTPGLFLIGVGCTMIIVLSNKEKQWKDVD